MIVLNCSEIVNLHDHQACIVFENILKIFCFQVASNKVSTKVKAISFAENGSYFVTAGNRWVDKIFLQHSQTQIYFCSLQACQVLVLGIFTKCQV